MQLKDIISKYSDDDLDQLSKDKLDEISNVRLPRAVLEQEIANALGSFSYIADILSASRPPTYAFIKILMEAENFSLPAEGFRDAVMRRTDMITDWISSGNGLPSGKNYDLYRAMLHAAWEQDERIDASEARMLEALRCELGLSMREHLLFEHHPDVRVTWDSPRAYETARNYLLSRGLVLTVDDYFVLPDEVRLQVRRYWGMELHDIDYRALLNLLTSKQLYEVLSTVGLASSGSKEERIERIVTGLVAPSETLYCLSIDELKDIARRCNLTVTLTKSDLIDHIIESFDGYTRRSVDEGIEENTKEPQEPETRILDNNQFSELLARLSINQLYEILALLDLPKTGSKQKRIQNLLNSLYSEHTILNQVRRIDLIEICRKLSLPVSGPKEELIERLITTDPIVEEEISIGESDLKLYSSDNISTGVTEKKEKKIDDYPTRDVPGLYEIRQDFPELKEDEQIMLALLKDARSLNERELERLAARHQIGWFLTKAHMSELLTKLSEYGRNPIRIRQTGTSNIYEWVLGIRGGQEELDRWAARDIINALRNGVVPERNLDMLMVGQEAARKQLLSELDYIETGRSAFKFIRGPYGAGKSFMAAWLRDQALSSGFAVSMVRVSAELSLSDQTAFFTGLMDGLRSPEKRNASSFSDILEAWLFSIQKNVAKTENLSFSNHNQQKKLKEAVSIRIREELAELATYDPGLAPALGAFYQSRLERDMETANIALSWIRGERSIANTALRNIGVRGTLETNQVWPRLRAILQIIATSRLRGLVILIDELELVRRRPHKHIRDQAYETLRLLIDEVGENRLQGCLVACTGTDNFFTDQKYGLLSYEALAHRIIHPEFGDKKSSMRQPVISLEQLNSERLRQVAVRTRDIHATAYGWPAQTRLPNFDIDTLIDKWTSFGGENIDRLPRPFLRQLVHILDLCEENPEIKPLDCFSEPENDPEANKAILEMISE